MSLPAPLSRLAALAILAGLVALVAGAVVLPALGHVDAMRARIALDREMIARLSDSAARARAAREGAEALAQEIAASPRYLSAETEALAALRLQARVQEAVDAAGGRISSIQTLPAETEAGLTRVALSLSLTAPSDALLRILSELESGTPFVFVERLAIRSDAARRQLIGQSGPVRLAVECVLHGYMPPAAAEAGG